MPSGGICDIFKTPQPSLHSCIPRTEVFSPEHAVQLALQVYAASDPWFGQV